MKLVRIIAATLAGYLVFALLSMLVITLLVSSEGVGYVLAALLALLGVGLASGTTSRLAAGPHRQIAGYCAAGLITLATLANLLIGLGAEPTWYKAGTLILTVPAVLWATHRKSAAEPK